MIMSEKMDRKKNDQSLERSGADLAGAVNADMNAAAAETHLDKFHAAQGHGFAAEQANHLYDILTGQDAVIVGGDNAKNGADRLVNGVSIQTKYCQSASGSVGAAFDQGQYRYINPDGLLMQLEVPFEQYEQAVKLMQKRIQNGEVPGVTDPNEACNIVRKGHFTYAQARNIAKFGTVESLSFDATTGAIVSTSAFGITATLTLARSLWNGDSPDIAVENAACAGVQVGGAAFANTVITSQIMRTGINKALTAPTDRIVELLGPDVSQIMANSLRNGAPIYGKAAMNNVAKLLRNNAVTLAVMTAVLSTKDISHIFQGKISGTQLFKNITTTAGGIAGGTAGGAAAGKLFAKYALKPLDLIVPGAGKVAEFTVTIVGAAVGGTAGGKAANVVVGRFIEDDAVKMVRIIETSFCQQAQEYMLSREELDIVLDDLRHTLEGETLLDMFASQDHAAFADKLVREQIERLVGLRCRVCLPSNDEFIQGIGRMVRDAAQETGVFAAKTTTGPVEVGRVLTGKELPLQADRKGLYAAKQMNLAQSQAESCLRKMAADEKKFTSDKQMIYQEREKLKNGLYELLGGTPE